MLGYGKPGENTDKLEAAEREVAERAQRLQALLNSEVWKDDVLPILHKIYDDFLQDVLKKEADPDVLKGLEEFIHRLGGTIRLGQGALERIASRRLTALTTKKEFENHQLPTLKGFTLG